MSKKNKYYFDALVTQTIRITIEADSLDEAYDMKDDGDYDLNDGDVEFEEIERIEFSGMRDANGYKSAADVSFDEAVAECEAENQREPIAVLPVLTATDLLDSMNGGDDES
jgi:hypothetical protein